MKYFFTVLFVATGLLSVNAQSGTFHQFKAATITGDTIDFMQFWGKKILVVNTASFCGYTPQFEDLQDLYEQYQQYNFEIIGFPCNNFGSQDPHDDSTILDFCTEEYGVTFQMMHKVEIATGDTAPVYKWLQRESLNGVSNADVTWNFHKFLIDEAGHWVAHYPSSTNPLSPVITNWIMSPSVFPADEAPTNQNDGLYETAADPTGITITTNDETVSSATVMIHSVDGRLVYSLVEEKIWKSKRVEYPQLHPGLYLVTIRHNNKIETFRHIVVY